MATENRRSRIRIDDWTGVTLTDVIPDGQERWYDNVTGYQSSEIIRLVGDGTTQVQNLLKLQPATDGAQTLYGVKTFNAIPVGPNSDPTTDNQLSRKKYVDDKLGLSPGVIFGVETTTAADADHDVTIATGRARSSDNTTDIILGSALTKQIDVAWNAGNNDGGALFAGAPSADTTYHFFLIYNPNTDTTDAGWDTSVDPTANLPSGYTKYRRIRSHVTDSSSNIINTIQVGDDFLLDDVIEDFDGNTTTTATNISLSVPSGLSLTAKISVQSNASVTQAVYVYSPLVNDPSSISNIFNTTIATAKNSANNSYIEVITDTNSNIRAKASGNLSTAIYLIGWKDNRGKFDGI